MEKKTYQQPAIEVMAAAPTEMIAASMLGEAETEVMRIIEAEEGSADDIKLGL